MMLDYDKTLQVGDYIIAYSKGIHRILSIGPIRPGDPRYAPDHIYAQPSAPLVKMEAVLNGNYMKSSKRISECDIFYKNKDG
jgi:hypothetical protein